MKKLRISVIFSNLVVTKIVITKIIAMHNFVTKFRNNIPPSIACFQALRLFGIFADFDSGSELN